MILICIEISMYVFIHLIIHLDENITESEIVGSVHSI